MQEQTKAVESKHQKKMRIRIIFTNIQASLIKAIGMFTSVCVCGPWFTSAPIIDAVSKLKGKSSLITIR